MTIKDLKRAYDSVEHCKVGYCCYQDAGISKYDLIELGYNRGVYGWNLPIAQKYFAILVLDYEFDDVCYCRILIDGNYAGQLTAVNRDQAIEKFLTGQWVHQ